MGKNESGGSSTKIAELTNYVREGNALVDEMNGHMDDLLGCIPQDIAKEKTEVAGTVHDLVTDTKRLVRNLKIAVERMREI